MDDYDISYQENTSDFMSTMMVKVNHLFQPNCQQIRVTNTIAP